MKFALVVIENEVSKRSVRENRTEHRGRLEKWMEQQASAGKASRRGRWFSTSIATMGTCSRRRRPPAKRVRKPTSCA
jgi:hypothetical protein